MADYSKLIFSYGNKICKVKVPTPSFVLTPPALISLKDM